MNDVISTLKGRRNELALEVGSIPSKRTRSCNQLVYGPDLGEPNWPASDVSVQLAASAELNNPPVVNLSLPKHLCPFRSSFSVPLL